MLSGPHCKPLHKEQKKALPLCWVSSGEGLSIPMGLRHWVLLCAVLMLTPHSFGTASGHTLLKWFWFSRSRMGFEILYFKNTSRGCHWCCFWGLYLDQYGSQNAWFLNTWNLTRIKRYCLKGKTGFQRLTAKKNQECKISFWILYNSSLQQYY